MRGTAFVEYGKNSGEPKMKVLYKYVIIISLFLFAGCDPNSDFGILFSPPKCEITNIKMENASPGNFAKFIITAENTGDGATAENVGCTVKLKIGNTIIDRGSAYFGSLNPGESAIDEAWFSHITNQNEYDSYEITLFWYDANGAYYQN